MKIQLNKKTERKILIHDYFQNYGGGERLIDILAEEFDKLIHGFDVNIVNKLFVNKINNLSLIKKKYPSFIKKIFTIISFYFLKISNCTVCLCSGNYALLTDVSNARTKIFYCHSLPKIFFSYNDFYKKNIIYFILLKIIKKFFLKLYLKKINQFDFIVANSKYTKHKISKIVNKKIFVIYPPINKRLFDKTKYKDFYVSNSRHEKEKQIEKIIYAFKKMPEKNLIITSMGTLTKKLKQITSNAKNIKFIGIVKNTKYQYLLNNCLGVINISKNEDFGMAAVEGMAHGKITFCLNEGGYKETTVNKYNAIYIDKKNTVKDLVKKIIYYDITKLIKLKKNCLKTAKQFDSKKFKKEILNLIKNHEKQFFNLS